MKERKIVQIAAMQDGAIAVLCDNGSLWKVQWLQRTGGKWEWTLISESGPKSFE
jgi:hypothetical protein